MGIANTTPQLKALALRVRPFRLKILYKGVRKKDFLSITQNKARGVMHGFFFSSMDGYCFHMTIPFHNLATENKAVLFCLPPPSTRPHLNFRCWGLSALEEQSSRKRERGKISGRGSKRILSWLILSFLLEQSLL